MRCRSVRAAERRRKWSCYIGEIFAVQRRGWMMKNKVRRKIGKVAMRFATLARKEAGFAPPICLGATRAERKARGSWPTRAQLEAANAPDMP